MIATLKISSSGGHDTSSAVRRPVTNCRSAGIQTTDRDHSAASNGVL
ncbi:hypothetical protein [Curtobacterium flaccumfaciens]